VVGLTKHGDFTPHVVACSHFRSDLRRSPPTRPEPQSRPGLCPLVPPGLRPHLQARHRPSAPAPGCQVPDARPLILQPDVAGSSMSPVLLQPAMIGSSTACRSPSSPGLLHPVKARPAAAPRQAPAIGLNCLCVCSSSGCLVSYSVFVLVELDVDYCTKGMCIFLTRKIVWPCCRP
jgi:hypothetical protein